ncbi:galactose mutarotase [Lentilactobacillus parafarraginis]|jgi:aldose 1-epimerase|uniref:Maltose epimerase n=2 Tax=Lentilactobacillus parafarraginis TaxID=390842 RepID=A0A0R1YQT5_9LACO|nr:aldose epimerase family protein [Lentilactobacillus parafarraginis]KRM44605.1 aldose 1-epimerase [Lentilactobacillus parafarraginis DSM 18390 = JCM 14109]TLQ18427.1 galactose mutarotase [Lentilactobacillus parafarraginis]
MTINSIVGTSQKFDEYQGQQVDKFTLVNSHHVSVSVLTLGSTLYELNVPDANGQPHNIVLNYQHSADYLKNPFYVCMAIGRVAGRIANGKLNIDGKSYSLPTNEGTTTLHGGPRGFNTFIWHGEIVNQHGNDVIVMHRIQTEVDDHFPGDMDVTITYSLSDDDTVAIKFDAKATEDTVFNPTQHTYFNLGNTDTIKQHLIKVNSSEVLELDDKKIPTANRINVKQTPWDFRIFHQLGRAIKGMDNTTEHGFDDVFAVAPDNNHMIAELEDPETNRAVAIESQRSGMIMFTANSFTHDHMNFVRTNGIGIPYLGVALEPMTLPKPGQDRDFSEMILRKGEQQEATIKYHVSY